MQCGRCSEASQVFSGMYVVAPCRQAGIGTCAASAHVSLWGCVRLGQEGGSGGHRDSEDSHRSRATYRHIPLTRSCPIGYGAVDLDSLYFTYPAHGLITTACWHDGLWRVCDGMLVCGLEWP